MGRVRGVTVLVLAAFLIVAVAPLTSATDRPAPDAEPPVAPREVTYTVPANYDTFVSWWQQLEFQYPGYLEMWSPNQRYGLGPIPSSSAHPPYDLHMVRLTNGSLGLNKPEVFFMGNPHGDERTGPIGAYWFVHWLLRHALTDAWNTTYDDWLNWLLDNREVYFLISHNPDGFDRIRRGDASGRDLNRETDHDWPDPSAGWPDVFTTVQGRTVVQFMEEHQIRAGMDFHGGVRAILIPWGSTHGSIVGVSPVTGRSWSYASPDFDFFDVFSHRMGDYMGDYNGQFNGNLGAFNIGTPFGIVGYVAQGTYLDWGYGSDTATNPAEAPYVRYGPYRGSGALWITPEISSTKNPPQSQYGGDETMGFGIDVRRMLLATIDIVQPYARWHPSGVRDGGAVQAGDFFELAWQVNGSLVVDTTYLQWGPDPDPVNNPSFATRLHEDFAGQYWGGTGWDGALDGATQGHVWRETVRAPTTLGTYYFVARAKVDQRYEEVLGAAEYGMSPYLRIVKERAVPGWSEDILGADGLEHMEYREWWDSEILRIDVVPDSTPPVITLRAPANNSIIRAGTVLDFDVVDGTLASVTASVDGAAPTPLPSPWDLDTVGWPDGPIDVRVTATDLGGLSTTGDYAFLLDSTPPSVVLVSPANGSVVTEGSVLDFDVSDANLAGVTWSTGGVLTPLAPPYDLSTTGWPEGPTTVLVNASDAAGNVASEAFDFAIDGGPPIVTLVAPPSGSVVRAGTVLDFDVVDVSAVAATWDSGTGLQPFLSPYDLDTTGWADGTVTISIVATDAFDRTTASAFPFTIDSTPPVLTLVSPADGAVVRPGTIVDLEPVDPNLDIVRWNAGFGETTLAPPYDVSTASWGDGTYSITARAVDAAGNEVVLAFTLTIDGTPPSVSRMDTVTLAAPGYLVPFSVQDPNLGPVFWSNGGAEATLAPPYEVDTTGWADGDYTVSVRATDLAGNEATVEGDVTLDGTAPSVAAISPSGDALSRPGLLVEFSVSDVHLAEVQLLVNGEVRTFSSPYEVDTAGWADGTYDLEVRATDTVGNVGSGLIRITIDGTPPALGLPTPGEARVGSPVTVQVTATDAHGPARVTLHWRLAGTAFTTVPMVPEGGVYVADIPSPTAEVALEAFASAEDDAGNVAETAIVSVAVAAAPPPDPGLSVWSWLPAVAVVAAAVLVAMFLLRRRRQRDR